MSEKPYIRTERVVETFDYNPLFGDNHTCKCGHSYYRHFDTYERMANVGCKYCPCMHFVLPVSLKIVPIDEPGDSRTGELHGCTPEMISETLGFEPNVDDDPSKVRYSWGFTANDVRCGIWDYKGSADSGEFSTFGPKEIFVQLFGADLVQ